MKNVASKPWALATVVVMLACAAVFTVVLVADVEAQQQQSSANEEEIAARVRAELEARLAHMTQRLQEQMQQIEMLRGEEMHKLQREIEAMAADEARMSEVVERRAQLAAEMQSRASEEMRHAMESAQQAVRRAGRSMYFSGGSCSTFGDTVLHQADELELSDDQVAQIREAQRAVRRDSIARNAEVEVGDMDLEALYEADEPNLAAIRAKLEELALLGVDGRMAGLSLRQQVRDILTPAQRDQFDEMRDETQVYVIVGGSGASRRMGGFGC